MVDLKHKTTEIFKKAFESSGISQSKFARLVNLSQPSIYNQLVGTHEIKLSSFQKYMRVFGIEYDIVCVKDENNLDLVPLLKKLEIDLIKQFSKETDYEIKYKLDKKIEAVKILLDFEIIEPRVTSESIGEYKVEVPFESTTYKIEHLEGQEPKIEKL